MVTLSQRTPRVKPARSIRLALRPTADHAGVVRIHQGKEEDSYLLYPFAADFGRAFRLVKDDGEHYDVLLAGPQSSCECKGFLRWGHCKHRDGLQALVAAGQLAEGGAA